MGYWGVGSEGAPVVTMPGIDLPDEVVSNRSRSSTGQGGYYPGMGMSTNAKTDLRIDGLSIRSVENAEGKRRVILEDSEFEDAHMASNHFHGF